MTFYQLNKACFFTTFLCMCAFLNATEKALPEDMKKIMHQAKYEHAIWGLYVKDLQTGKILFDLHSNLLFSPASTTKLFSVEALLQAYGDDYRFKTPVYATGKIQDGQLQGNLILVAQGDLTMGGRQDQSDKISYTKMDHIIANQVPGAILTKEDPLYGLQALAKQIYQKGITEIQGDVLIDDTLFETTEKREMSLSPIMINENFIDIVINPSAVGQLAQLSWRPEVASYDVKNEIKTVASGEAPAIEISADASGHHILVKGTIPLDQHQLVRTFSIQNPTDFARDAFIQALKNQGIKLNLPKEKMPVTASLNTYKDPQQVALWTSPPLSEYAKLILKVSHNLGADLVPLLLAAKQGKKTFEEGMFILGQFVKQNVKLSTDTFVFIDGAGGNENRLTPQAEVKLLEFINKQPVQEFQHFFDSLPILGVDGSLEDFAKETQAVGKVRAKTGTGVAFNLATHDYFLITQAAAGYIEGKNGHLLAYMLTVNNGKMPTQDDIFPIFEDLSQLSSLIYQHSDTKEGE